MKTLFAFGHSPVEDHSRQDQQPPQRPTAALLQAPSISILWASWCDLIVAHAHSSRLVYYGASLNPAQAALIEKVECSVTPFFFGRALDHGVRGFVIPTARELTVFHLPAAAKDPGRTNGAAETISFQATDFDILDVRFTSGQSVFVSLKANVSIRDDSNETADAVKILQFSSLEQFTQFLKSEPHVFDEDSQTNKHSSNPKPSRHILTSSLPVQLYTNATTLTALSSTSGQVHTFSPDPRFPKCIGRHTTSADAAAAHPIPYLSEVRIGKIASGGYYTCAVSASASQSDGGEGEEVGGELYLWGQAPPGTDHEISVLRDPRSSEDSDSAEDFWDDQDDFVKCVELQVDGLAAEATDVAVGWGHVLVAVEAAGPERDVSRAVFAAGCNARRQLGLEGKSGCLDFVNEFTEVEVLKGKRVMQMVCCGWSSYVVVEED